MKNSLIKSLKIPSKAGIYFFKNKNKELIYIGKSVNLRHRVKNYFQQQKNFGDLTKKMVSEIKTIDWKIFASEFEALLWEAKLINQYQPKYNIRSKDDKSFILIAITKEEYPLILSTRDKSLKADYFGPFLSSQDVRQVLKIIRRIFPYRTCKNLRKKTCLYYHLDLCPGCCINYPKKEYRKNIKKIIRFLQGNINYLKKDLSKEMTLAAKNLQFEQAAKIKKQLNAINQVTSQWQAFSEDNLSFDLIQDNQRQILREIKTIFPKIISLARIEAYDISNLQGKEATGSMVVFENGKPNKNQYRRFKIKGKNLPDDPAMIKEVINRRLKHQEWLMPNLMIIDGGKGQLGAVFSVLRENNLNKKIFLLGLTKKQEILIKSKILKKTIIGWEEIKLPINSHLLRLFQHLRDESHRFARNYHLILRRKKLNETN